MKHSLPLLYLTAVLLLLCSPESSCFVPLKTRSRPLIYIASPLFSSRSKQSSKEEESAPNLYAILGASPKDSDEELKRKWQQLARKLHPDANIYSNRNNEGQEGQGMVQQGLSMEPENSHPYDISDVNAAWGVLSDPKERRRYDRSLQAQELADTFEILLDAGIKTAIPFFKKTADEAVKLGEQSGKTLKDVSQKSNDIMNDVNRKMKLNSEIYDLEIDSRDADRKAANARARMQRLRNKLETQNTRQLPILQNPNAPLTSQEAIRLVGRFAAKDKGNTDPEQPNNNRMSPGASVFADTNVEINYLEDLEFQYKDQQKYHQSTIQNLNTVQKQAQDAILAEQKAQERLLQAQQDLMDAQARNHACQKAQFEAVQFEKEALQDGNAIAEQLNQQTQKVRYVLRQKESESLAREAQLLQEKLRLLDQEQIQYEQQAAEFKAQAFQLRQQEKNEGRY